MSEFPENCSEMASERGFDRTEMIFCRNSVKEHRYRLADSGFFKNF
jgi:hypothetical protein